MPTYEYRCGACGHEFEKFHKMSADPVRVCPECGENEVERLISPGAGIVFKGSGFYATDYRDPPRKSREERDATGGDGSGEGDGDSGGAGNGGAGKDGSRSEGGAASGGAGGEKTGTSE